MWWWWLWCAGGCGVMGAFVWFGVVLAVIEKWLRADGAKNIFLSLFDYN